MAALIAVLADEHPLRDAWVDEQARQAPGDTGVPVGDDTYHGVWRLPLPERTTVHLFALSEDVPVLERHGLERVGDSG